MKLSGGPVGAGKENQKVYNGLIISMLQRYVVRQWGLGNRIIGCLHFTNGQYYICLSEFFSINHSIPASV